jgi:hypothetical protein
VVSQLVIYSFVSSWHDFDKLWLVGFVTCLSQWILVLQRLLVQDHADSSQSQSERAMLWHLRRENSIPLCQEEVINFRCSAYFKLFIVISDLSFLSVRSVRSSVSIILQLLSLICSYSG